MRTRDEINQQAIDFIEESSSWQRANAKINQLNLEVLLDIRQILDEDLNSS